MFRSLRRRLTAVGLAIGSLLPNAGKVSFMGAKDASKIAVQAVRNAAVAAEPVVEKVAQVTSTNGGKAAVVGGSAVVGGGAVMAERGCFRAGRALVESGERAVPGAVRTGSREALEAGGHVPLPKPGVPVPRSIPVPILIPQEVSVAGRAVHEAGLTITGAHDATGQLLASRLRSETVRMTDEVIRKVPIKNLTSRSEVAKAFEESVVRSKNYYATFDSTTGLVQMHIERNGVRVAAEFNAYTATKAAAVIAAAPLAPEIQDLSRKPGRDR